MLFIPFRGVLSYKKTQFETVLSSIPFSLVRHKKSSLTKWIYPLARRSDSFFDNKSNVFGGTEWESNPPDLARRSQAVLKTVEDPSTQFILSLRIELSNKS